MDPKDAKKARKERELSSVIPTKGSLNDDPDRPKMKRGSTEAGDDLPALNGLPADMKQMVAVSDAKRRDAHPFAREWEDEAEKTAVMGKMRAAAQAQLIAYGPVPAGTPTVVASAVTTPVQTGTVAGASGGAVTQDTSAGTPPVLRRNHVASTAPASEQVTAGVIPPAPAAAPALAAGSTAAGGAKTAAGTRTAAARRANSKLRHGVTAETAPSPERTLVDEQIRGFTLSYGGAATYVYTAHTAGVGAGLRYVTVVAQEDGVNGLKVADAIGDGCGASGPAGVDAVCGRGGCGGFEPGKSAV